MRTIKNTRGFTLLEVALAVAVLVIIAAATIPNLAEDQNRTRTNLTVGEIQAFSEAARLFAAKETPFNGNPWPDAQNNCRNAITTLIAEEYLSGIDATSPFRTNYVTSCSAKILQIEVKTKSDFAGIIVNSLPATVFKRNTSDETITSVPLPGSIPALEQVLHRVKVEDNDKLNQMETPLDMGNQNIVGANNITTQTLNASGNVTGSRFVDTQNSLFQVDPDQNSNIRSLDTRSANAGEFALTTRDVNGGLNQQLRSNNGSISANDVFIRSRNAFVSELAMPCDWNGLSLCSGRLDEGTDGTYSAVRLECRNGFVVRAHQALEGRGAECILR